MDNLDQAYESDEGEGEFYGFGEGRLGGLGEVGEVEIINREGNCGVENREEENPEDEYQEDEVLEGDESEEGNSDEAEAQGVRENQHDIALAQALPPVPSFEPYKHPRPSHKRILNFPQEFHGRSPSDFFMLFFGEGQFTNFAQNTNAYATVKEAGRDGSRKWYATQAGEMMIFVGLIIYMGLYHSSAVPDYWRKDGHAPLHR